MSDITILEANLDLTIHSQAVLDLINAYAADPMGNGRALEPDVMKNLIPGLKKHPNTLVFLGFAENKAVGILTGFKGFSTFNAKPLINISDFYIHPAHRGKGIGMMLLKAVEQKAVETACCKITLEVQQNNEKAKKIYSAAGFKQDVHVPEAGPALFYSKKIS